MIVKKKIEKQILSIVSDIGASGATITEIEKKMSFERHTVSKYLSFMEANGLLRHKAVGKAKLWFINKAPIQTLMDSANTEHKTFTEKVLSDIVSTLPNGLAVIDSSYTILFMSSRLVDWYGHREGQRFYEAVLGLDNPVKLRKITRIIDGIADTCEMTLVDSRFRTLSIRGSKLINPDERLSVVLSIEDITERVRAQEEVMRQKRLLEAEREALNKSAIVAETDVKGKITYVNDKFVEISGYSRKELLGKDHSIINSGHHPASFFRKMWTTISSGKTWIGMIKNKAKSGRFYWVESAITPVLGADGKPIKYLAVRFDVSKYVKD